MTQMEAAEVALKSRAMVGKAMLTMVLSRTDMTIASAIAAMAQYRRGIGRPSGWTVGAAALEADTGTSYIRRRAPRCHNVAPRRGRGSAAPQTFARPRPAA